MFLTDKGPFRLFASISTAIFFAGFAIGQQATPSPTPPVDQPITVTQEQIASGNLTAEQVAELSIAVYGFPSGRATLNQIRKTVVERGRLTVTNGNGRTENATYTRWFLRSDDGTERTRYDQQFPGTSYSLVLNGEDLFLIFGDAVLPPRDDAASAFQNQLFHSVDALHRYKENGSTLALSGRDKIMGVDYHLLDLTDKKGRKTRFYISSKSFRVMILEYESGGSTYRRKFYDHRFAQGTLVPYRTVLSSGDRILEEVNIGTVTYGQKVDEGLFQRPR